MKLQIKNEFKRIELLDPQIQKVVDILFVDEADYPRLNKYYPFIFEEVQEPKTNQDNAIPEQAGNDENSDDVKGEGEAAAS